MGKTTKKAPEKEPQDIAENVSEEKVSEKAEKKGYVKYCLPFMPDTKMGDTITVTINGKNTQVQYGVEQLIPIGVRDVLADMVEQARIVAEKIDALDGQERLIAIMK